MERHFIRNRVLRIFVLVVFVALAARLLWIQIVDGSYKQMASNNTLRHEVLYPPRGEVLDRNGEYIIQSKESYDLVVVPRDLKTFDTLLVCRIVDITLPRMRAQLARAAGYSSRRPSVVVPQLSKETKLLLDELKVPGFYTVYRTVRSYPRKIAGNLLGYLNEVNYTDLERDDYYRSGDYIGRSGIEQAYEKYLRGEKGVKINMVDVHGIVKGSWQDGLYDTLPVAGKTLVSSLDAGLQAFGEELMRGKVGSVVAIEPSTGEILMMVNAPTYDPDELVGRERNNNYARLANDNRRPLFNRSVMSAYPPGSTFKMVNGLIGLQEGVLKPSQRYECHHGYTAGNLTLGCHDHFSPLNLQQAIMTSCNAYFCYVLRNIMDKPGNGGIMKGGYEHWAEHVRSFGFGRKLDSDFTAEYAGNVYGADYYDKTYRGRWNSLTVISLAIGQGELGCSPLQLANLAATIANRGHYYIPHVIKEIEDMPLDPKFSEPHYTDIAREHFEPIIEGMYMAAHSPGGTVMANGYVPGLEICGKTGTAQNAHRDHSVFLGFAPRDNPKIAICVYVENAGFGSTAAVPIGSLVMEQYINDTITRPWLADHVRNMQIRYPHYDSAN
uniref:Putative penicillin-binding protein n=1 Tax=termite gut metagenome TaxID=433724 RepID=S0DDC9_9ZZZZ